MGDLPSAIDEEFIPLPYYPWDHRPSTTPIGAEEAATALYLAEGEVVLAAATLKVEPLRLIRVIRRSPRLTRLHQELVSLLNDKVHHEYKRAFADEDDRRREWAASKISQTRQFQDHPLAPNQSTPTNATLTLGGPTKIIISWDDGPQTIEHDSD
jgi:hypothetical protein